MRTIIEPMVTTILNTLNNEPFSDKMNSKGFNYIGGGVAPTAAILISIILSQILLLLFGKWLWNSFLVPAIPNIQPLESIGHLFGLSILIKLLFH
jgi:hypothetical protein